MIAGQWLNYIGAESIGTVGSDDKIELAKDAGYSHVINYNKSNFVEEVRRITDGIGVDVAYDSVGQATYPNTLSCLKKFGLFVSFKLGFRRLRNPLDHCDLLLSLRSSPLCGCKVQTCVCVCVCMCVRMCVYVCICMCVCVYVYMYVCLYACKSIYLCGGVLG